MLLIVECFCGCWCLTLWEECKLSMFENRALRRIYGPKGEAATGAFRKLHERNFIVCFTVHIQVIYSQFILFSVYY